MQFKRSDVRDGVSKLVFMVIVFLLATTTRGEWLLVIAYLFRERLQEYLSASNTNETLADTSPQKWRFSNVHVYVLLSVATSFAMYYGMAWGWQWYYYIQRREQSEEWKCQPGKFLSPENERHEMLTGTFNMLCGSIVSGFLACYIINGGYSSLYYSISEYGWSYFFASFLVLHLYIEFMNYYLHRGLHIPFFYKHIHKWHHRYHQPTAFSATAMHPVEFFLYQSYLGVIPFIIRVHVGVYIAILLYTYYYGMCDHSGIKMKALWPWQPDSMYHDDHHKYFHVNFGLNSPLFDWLHGTFRRNDRIYGEDIFGGHGRARQQHANGKND